MAVFYRRLPRFEYLAPRSLGETMSLLAEHGPQARVMAGGTDLIPQLRKRETVAPVYVVDLKSIPGLDAITFDRAAGLFIGPLATINAIAASPVVRDYPAIREAALSMASPQVRNRGTFAGNVCNGVPSADSAPGLLACGAVARIKGPEGERKVPMEQFFEGPRKTVLKPEELLVGIEVPEPRPGSRGTYLKLSPRHSMDLAVVGIAVQGICEDGVCKEVRIALGAVAPTPIRAPMAEAILAGQRITPELIEEAAQNAITQCSPIDDHRASREYRCDMVRVMTRRALGRVFS
jgi:CO/xanthine dehydrogenase FAD-binding subunit